jgi:hypothetical protein
LKAARVGGSFEFLGAGGGLGCINDLIHTLWRGGLVSFLFVDPVPYQWFAVRGGWVPGDAGDDEVPV